MATEPTNTQKPAQKSKPAVVAPAVVMPEGLTIYDQSSEKQAYVLEEFVYTVTVPAWTQYINTFVTETDKALRAANPSALARKVKVYDASSAISVLLENLERVSPGYSEYVKNGTVDGKSHPFASATRNPHANNDGQDIYDGPAKQQTLALSELAHAGTLPRLEAYLNAHAVEADRLMREANPNRPLRKVRQYNAATALNELLKNLFRLHVRFAEYDKSGTIDLSEPPFGAQGKRK